MRRMAGGIAALLIVVVVAALIVYEAQAPSAPAALPLVKTFDQSPTGFTLQYPDEWEYMIPALGIAVFGPPETLYDNVPGPTFTIQRAEPLSVVGTLDNALDRYLQNGPLRTPERWQIADAVHPTQLEGRNARVVTVRGSGSDQAPTLETRIFATQADNTFVYFFVTSAPEEKKATFDPTFDAMLGSVQILE